MLVFSTVSSVQSLLFCPLLLTTATISEALALCSYCSKELERVFRSFDATQTSIFMNLSFPGRTNKTCICGLKEIPLKINPNCLAVFV